MSNLLQMFRILLWVCIEDYAGLWELEWELATKFPDISPETRRESLRNIVSKLMGSGLIILYQCQEPYGDTRPLSEEEARKAIESDEAWVCPEAQAKSIRVSATKEGEKIYQADNFNALI